MGQIIRFTQLKPRTVRGAILVLVQHNLLWHAQSEDEGGEVFEMNTEECMMRLRYGRYVAKAEQLFGKAVRIFFPLGVDFKQAYVVLLWSRVRRSFSSSLTMANFVRPTSHLSFHCTIP